MRAVFWWYCGSVAAAAAAYGSIPTQYQDVLYTLVSAGAVVAVVVGVRLHRPKSRVPWRLLTIGLFCSFIADLSYNLLLDVPQLEVPFPSVADGMYLLYYPMLFLSIGSFLKVSGRPDRAAWVDASIWTIGVAALLWEPLIKPYVLDADANTLAYAVALAYPLLDLGLLLMVLRMLGGRASMNASYLLLTSAVLIQVFVDFIYGVRVVQGTYVSGELTDLGYMLISLLIGAAALHPSMVRLAKPAPRPADLSSRRRLQALVIPALIPPALLIYELQFGDTGITVGDGHFIAVTVSVLAILVVTRGGGLLRVAEMRSRQLVDRTTALEVALVDRELASRALQIRVNQDTLTGLASRDHFVEGLQAAVHVWRNGGPSPSVAFLDLDDFKTINDTLGHEAGDLLLVEIARRMREALPGQLVARFGGDEFAVLIDCDPATMAANLVDLMQRPFLLHGRELRPQVSIGVTTARTSMSSSSELLREADVAMYVAKRAGGGWVPYQLGMSAVLVERLDLRNRLVQALKTGEVQPWFQPVVDLASGRLLGFEALARWCVDDVPIRTPIEWLPLAEESGLILEVDRVILHAAIAQLARWRDDAPDTELELAINLSGRTLQQPGIEDEVIEAIRVSGVPAHRLIVEVTEGVLIDDDEVSNRLRRLRAAGVRIALDDFGTGWSSLSYLHKFPVDHLKLDRSFTNDLGRTPAADAIPAAIVHLARGLSLGVVAEGVETIDQCQRLLALGFRVGQGYLFGRAQPACDLSTQVRRSRPLLEALNDD